MQIRSHLLATATALLLVFHVASSAAALSLNLNGTPFADEAVAVERASTHAVEGRVRTGVSLGELYPLMFEVHSLRVSYEGGEIRLGSSKDIADLFGHVLYRDGRSWSLHTDSRTLEEVESIAVEGLPLDVEELTVWLSWEGTDIIEGEIDRFARLFGIDVQSSTIPDTGSKLGATERARGEPADVVLIQSSFVPDLRKLEALQPLGPAEQEDPPTPAQAAFTVDGSVWARSLYFDSHLVFYNPQILEETPAEGWTLRDLERIAASARSHVEVPLTWNAYSAYWLTPFVLGYGKDRIVSEDGRVHVDDEPTRRAVTRILEMVEDGALTVMERDAMTAYFTSGRAAIILTGSYSIPSFEKLGIPFDVAPFPHIAETGEPVRPFLDFKGFAVSRRARHPVLARRFIEYMTSPAVQARITLPIRKMPAEEQAWPLVADEHPYAEALMKSYQIGVPVPNRRGYTVYKSLMWRMLRFVFDGRMEVRPMLERSDRMIEEAMKGG